MENLFRQFYGSEEHNSGPVRPRPVISQPTGVDKPKHNEMITINGAA
jgi:hypothetical protein